MELLNVSNILASMSETTKSLVSKLIILPTIDSTNTQLLKHCREYDKGTILIAEEQTAGRGRHGKAWFSPQTGNIYGSLLWHVPINTMIAPLSLAIAVMLVQGMERFGIKDKLQLKWPNDIYFANKKLAGILIESALVNEDYYAIVIGFGINLHVPQVNEIAETAISLSNILQKPISRNHLTSHLIEALLLGLIDYEQHGFPGFYQAWQQYDMLIGKSIKVTTGKSSIQGVALGVNLQGELCMRTDEGKEYFFHSGEVSVIFSP